MNEEDTFESYLNDASGSPDIEDLLALREEASDSAYLAKDKENKRLEAYARLQGVEPPPKRGPALVPEVFDYLDAPHQGVAGMIASILNVPGYEDQPLWESFRKGQKENIGTADILHAKGITNEMLDSTLPFASTLPIGRFVVPLAGDIATDPFSYLTGGASTFARQGGRGLSKVGAEVAAGLRVAERSKRVAAVPQTLAEAIQAIPSKGPRIFEALPDAVKAQIDSEITPEIGKVFQSASAVSKEIKKSKRLQAGLGNEGGELASAYAEDLAFQEAKATDLLGRMGAEDHAAIMAGHYGPGLQEGYLKGSIGLDPETKLDDLFARPAIGWTTPWKGAGGHNFNIEDGVYPVAGAQSGTIPGITAASTKFFDALDGPLYSADLNIGKYMRDTERKLLDYGRNVGDSEIPFKLGVAADVLGEGFTRGAGLGIGQTLKFLNDGVTIARKVPGLFSREAIARSKETSENVREYALARQAALQKVDKRAAEIFSDAPPEVLDMASSPWHTATKSDPTRNILGKSGEVLKYGAKFSRRTFDQTASDVMDAVRGTHGDTAASTIGKAIYTVEDDYRLMNEAERAAGIADTSIEGYLNAVYDRLGGISPSDKEAMLKESIAAFRNTATPENSIMRTYEVIGEAAAKRNLSPVLNLKDLYKARKLSHELNMASADFFNRQRLMSGYSPEVVAKLKNAIAGGNAKLSGVAARYMKERGVVLRDPDLTDIALKNFSDEGEKLGYAVGKKTVGPAPIIMHEGTMVTPEDLAAWERQSVQDLPGARQIADQLRLPYKINPYLGPGAGVESAPQLVFEPSIKADLKFLGDIAKQQRALLPGRLGEVITTRSGAEFSPRTIEKMVLNNFADNPEAQDLVEHYASGGLLPKHVVNSLQDALDTSGYLDKAIKRAGGNSTLESFKKSILGYLKLHKLATTLPFPGYQMQNLTSTIPLAITALKTIGPSLSPVRMYQVADVINGKTIGRAANGAYITGDVLKRYMQQYGILQRPGSKEEITDAISAGLHSFNPNKEQAAKEVNNILTRTKNNFLGLSAKVENLGRQWVFSDLVLQGVDPADAAARTAKAFTDYSAGKTRFERNFLNNLFFFYSFARAQTANTLVNLVTNPGALTAQIHMFDAAANVLKDPNAQPLPPDVDEQVKSLRTYDSLSKFVGRNKKGLPEFLTSVGLPMEQVSKWFNFQTPRDWGSLSDWMNTTGDNARNIFRNQVAALNPPLAKVFEMATGRNWFFDRPITDESLRRIADPKVAKSFASIVPFPYNAVPNAIIDDLDSFTKNMMAGHDNGDGTQTVNPYSLAILTMLVPGAGRATQTLSYLARQDQDTSSKLARFFTGARVSPQDIDKSLVYDRNQQLNTFFDVNSLKKSKAKIKQRALGEQLATQYGGEEE